jgi:hypothetical protein
LAANLRSTPFLGYKVGIRSTRHSRLALILRVQSEFSTVFLQEHFYVSAIEIEFRIRFRVLADRKTAECCCRAFDSTPHGSEPSRISSAYLRLCRSRAYLRTDAPKNHVSWSVSLQEHWCATWALRVALSPAAAGRLCSFRNTSTFSAIEIEFGICLRVHTGRKDRLSVAP